MLVIECIWQHAQAMFRKSISFDAFACPQSKVTSRFTSRHFAPEALTEDGLLLDWSSEVVCLNPPWALLPDVICKIRVERPAAVLIVPVCPSQAWWPFLLDLGAIHVDLPPPKFSVLPRLLWAGRRESTKVSYSGKWMRFVYFYTLTLFCDQLSVTMLT
jgi:hypothetical protein